MNIADPSLLNRVQASLSHTTHTHLSHTYVIIYTSLSLSPKATLQRLKATSQHQTTLLTTTLETTTTAL